MKLEYMVKKEDNNLCIKDILKNKLYISTSLLLKLKNSNVIFLNNNTEFVNKKILENDVITINLELIEEKKEKINCYDFDLEVLYEDEYILIVNKPNGIQIHGSLNNYDENLSNAIMNYYVKNNYNISKVHILTRLDKDTSGICVIAKNEYIQNLFSKRKDLINLKKEYITVVNGIVEKDHDVIEKNICRKDGSIIIRKVSDIGDYAKTEYNVLKRNIQNNYTILNIILHTGRTHQIRVHMAHLGHVLLRR